MINETIERLPSEIVQGFMNLLRHDSITCAISDCMGRFNAMTSDMVSRWLQLCGPPHRSLPKIPSPRPHPLEARTH